METQAQPKQTKTKPKDMSVFPIYPLVTRAVKISHAQLRDAPMVPGGLMGAEKSINATKVKGVEMFLQPNGMLWCTVKGQWFVIPESNVLDYVVDKSVEVE